MGCNCGKPKCDGQCGCKSPAVLQINNPPEYITFHKVSVPAAMGDSTTNPPAVGKYKNVLLYYEADQTSWLYSTDGIPTKLTNGITNYEDAINLPQINGHTLLGNQSSSDLGLQGELTAGANIQINGNVISATDTTYTAGNGIELDGTEIKAKIGDGLEFDSNGEIDIADIEQYAHFFDNVADMKASENLIAGSYARTTGYYSANDGGGALYKIRTVTNDDVIDEGFIVEMNDAQNQLVAELIIENNEVNVKQFGAYGDGTHDDTTAISNALSKGGNVHLPTGSYKLTSKINLSNISAHIYGDGSVGGRGGTTAYAPSTTIISPTNEFAFKTTYPKRNYFTHLRFDGKGVDELAGGVYECDFLGSVGIYYLRGRCDKCYFDCSTTGIDTAVDATITNCTFANCGKAISLHGSDNRINNNRIDWNNLGIELTSASYNTIEGNIFDRQTTYGMTIDNGCHHNNITGNLFERNLINHIKGALYDVTLNSNKFIKKIIIDGDESSDKLPTTAFDFSDFFNSSLVGNEIYADKINETFIQLSNTSSAVGNIVNNKNTDFIYTKLGDLTVGANTVGTLDVQWSAIKANILNLPNGANFSLANIEVRDGNYRNYIGSDMITDLNYDPYWNIQVVVNNNTSSSKTYNIYAKFEQINIFRLDFSNA